MRRPISAFLRLGGAGSTVLLVAADEATMADVNTADFEFEGEAPKVPPATPLSFVDVPKQESTDTAANIAVDTATNTATDTVTDTATDTATDTVTTTKGPCAGGAPSWLRAAYKSPTVQAFSDMLDKLVIKTQEEACAMECILKKHQLRLLGDEDAKKFCDATKTSSPAASSFIATRPPQPGGGSDDPVSIEGDAYEPGSLFSCSSCNLCSPSHSETVVNDLVAADKEHLRGNFASGYPAWREKYTSVTRQQHLWWIRTGQIGATEAKGAWERYTKWCDGEDRWMSRATSMLRCTDGY
ncbi:unnamed protein product [Amoebophrya sp. A120]|nr:unnamed protein product [Amoebophrya sp. A120]|eukprot:GSA120T00016474001.1